MQHQPPKHIKKLQFSNEREWLAARQSDVTASVAGALFGLHQFTTPYALWADKAGKLPPEDAAGNEAILRGKLLEPVAVALMRRTCPAWEIIHNTDDETVYYRDEVNRIGATPDTLIICPERGPGTVQIKSVESSIFRKKWCAEGEPEPPLWIAIQAIIEAYMTGSEWAAVAPLVVGHGLEMPIIEIPLADNIMPAVIRKAAEFWALVKSGDEPEPDFSKDQGIIDRLAGADGDEVDLVSNRRAYQLVEDRARARDAYVSAEQQIAEIDAELKHLMRGASLAYLPAGLRMTWRESRRVAPDGRVTRYRVLRVPRPAELVLPPTAAPEAAKPVDSDKWKF